MPPSPKRMVDLLLGLQSMQTISAFIARMGMRGAGINLSYELDQSGEARILSRIGAAYPGFSCLDAGANIGGYARAAIAAGAAKVVAFEPVPVTFDKLKKNTAGLAVELQQRALGESNGETEIFVPLRSSHASRDPLAGGFTHAEAQKVTVPITTIDDYCFQHSFFPTLIKIDVEGFEQEALTGAQKLLRDTLKPAFVQFEFNLHHLYRRQTLDDLKALLPGYHLFRLTASGLSRIGAYRGMDTIYGYMNILACLDEKPFSASRGAGR